MLPLQSKREANQETFIGSSVKVDGKFIASGVVTIEGILNGSLKTDGDLIIGKTAKISANTEAVNAHCSGEIHGNVKVKERLELESTAKIFGDVEAKVLRVSEGAILQGKCTMMKTEEPKKSL